MNFRSEKCIFQAGGGQAVHDLGEVLPRDDADGGRVPQGRRLAVLRGREAPRVPAPFTFRRSSVCVFDTFS